MYINDRTPRVKKRDTMARWISCVNDAEQSKLQKLQEVKEKNAKKKEVICEVIQLFESTFEKSPEVLAVVRILFEQWKEHEYRKDLPQARVQIANVMIQNGYFSELDVWRNILTKKGLA